MAYQNIRGTTSRGTQQRLKILNHACKRAWLASLVAPPDAGTVVTDCARPRGNHLLYRIPREGTTRETGFEDDRRFSGAGLVRVQPAVLERDEPSRRRMSSPVLPQSVLLIGYADNNQEENNCEDDSNCFEKQVAG